MSNIKQRFGAEVRAARLEEGLTQKQLALKTDLNVPTISRIENGGQNVSIELQEKLANALNRVITNHILVKP